MVSMNILEKLKQKLNEKIKGLKIEISSNKVQEECLKDMNDFLEKIQLGELDKSLLIKIQGEIQTDATIEYIELVWNSINDLDPDIFGTQIQKCKKIIQDFVDSLKKAREKKLQEIENAKINLQKFIDEETKYLRMNGALEVDGFTKLIDKELFFELVEFSKQNLTLEETEELVYLLAKHNETICKRIIEEKIAAETLAQQQREEESRNRVKESEKTEVFSNVEIIFENKQFQSLYETARKLIGSYEFLKENKDVIECIVPSLKDVSDINQRIENYKLVSDTQTQTELLLYDLKDNILPMIESKYPEVDESLFGLVAFVLESYELIQRTKKWNETSELDNISSRLLRMGMDLEFELLEDSKDVVKQLNEYIEERYKRNSYQAKREQKVYALIGEINDCISEYCDAITLMLTDPFAMYEEEYKEFIEESFSKLANKTAQAKKVYEELRSLSAETISDSSMLSLQEFYGPKGDIHHLIFLLGEDGKENSFVESDIIEDKNLNDHNVGSIVTELSKRSKMTHQEFEMSNDHKIKTDNFAESFLQKYHVKSASAGQSRIFFTKFKTNIGTRFKEYPEDLSIMLVIATGFGALGENSKKQLYEDALRRCYKFTNQIDSLIAFLNPNWDDMSEQEIQLRKRQISEMLSQNDKRIIHLIDMLQSTDKKRR